jgi:uncharacterized protein YecT (DUF1311 family)
LNARHEEVIRRLPFADLSEADKTKAGAEFIASQRVWSQFRDTECAATAVINGGGDATKYASADCVNRHIKQRIDDLERYINYLPDEQLK